MLCLLGAGTIFIRLMQLTLSWNKMILSTGYPCTSVRYQARPYQASHYWLQWALPQWNFSDWSYAFCSFPKHHFNSGVSFTVNVHCKWWINICPSSSTSFNFRCFVPLKCFITHLLCSQSSSSGFLTNVARKNIAKCMSGWPWFIRKSNFAT